MVIMYFPEGEEREVDGEGPKVLDVGTVRYWNRHTKELKGSQVKKAEQFVLYDCLQYLGNNRFVCLPLNSLTEWQFENRVFTKKAFPHDYNSSEYVIEKTSEKTFCCNCQGYFTKMKRGELVPEGANCSHVLGLYYAFSLKKFAHPQQKLLVEGL